AQYPDLLTVIAPRHPVRGTTILALIAQHGLTVAQRSLGVLPIADTEIYLADTLGELGILYRLCHICCVGGSFVPVGGHNPIEPALLDTAIIFGPLMTNFSEVAEQMVAAKAARQVQNGEELTGVLRALLAEPAAVHTLATTAQAWATAQDQVHDRIIAALDPILRQAHIR
ncbi:MAG: 3-deoxy-D-manno-octulosonic acid transferase, partial [Hyphomicrobium sp.]